MKFRFKALILFVICGLCCFLATVACNERNDNTDNNTSKDSVTEEPEESGIGTEESSENSSCPDTDETVTDETQNTDDVVVNRIYPVPQNVSVTKECMVDISTITLNENAKNFGNILSSFGLKTGENGKNIDVEYCSLSNDFEFGADEAYIMSVSEDGVTIKAQNERGAYYAIVSLGQLINGTEIPEVTIKDAPTLAMRGVIEGFYGEAWTNEFRKELFDFMGDNKMNTYIYAPKDDVKHRAKWRSLYTGEELDRMRELVYAASKNRVRFVYAISPGIDINLGSGYSADFDKLVAKCEQMYGLGVRDFAIFLDDIPTLDAKGHAMLLNDFQTEFVNTHEGVSDLIAITTEYSDVFLTSYTDEIAPLIHKDIELMWTGPGVVPDKITNQSLKTIVNKLNRKVFIWWNYPVNDVLVNNLYMGPCEGLESTLYQSVTGLVSNPMNQGYASLVPIFTIADYLWNPQAYDNDASLDAAIEYVCPDAKEELSLFISMTCSCVMNNNVDSRKIKTLLNAYKEEKSAENIEALLTYFDSMIVASEALKNCENQGLYNDISEWIDKFHAYGLMGKAFFSMEYEYANGRNTEKILSRLGEYIEAEKSVSDNPRLVSRDVLAAFLQTAKSRINVLTGQENEISFAKATPITDCKAYMDYEAKFITDGEDSTFFWTHGSLAQASNDGVGYFGVDLGEVIEIHNIYVATGVNGSDALTAGALEYSSDKKIWTLIKEGSLTDEIFVEDLNVNARYVRVRCTDRANNSWVKVKSFEVNTTRTAAKAPVINSAITTSLPVYSTYEAKLACDKNTNTYFWSSRAGQVGDYIQLDLGSVVIVTKVSFMSGVAGHEADYINNGELSYSENGVDWTVIGKVNSRETEYDVNVKARYFRVVIKQNQTSWITVSEFSAISDSEVSDKLALDEYFVARSELLTLQDSDLLTVFAPDKAISAGHSLLVTFGESGQVRIVNLKVPSNGLCVNIVDMSGKIIRTAILCYDTTIKAQPGCILVIPLDAGLMIAQVQW